MTEPGQMRVSDADRHQVAEILRTAAGEGRIELDELEERLEATYAARTYADLVPITADLPVRPTPSVPVPTTSSGPPAYEGGAQRYTTSVAVMSGVDRKGVWEVGPTHQAFAMMAGITVDLREAVFTTREVVITANALWSGVDIVVNERTRVVIDGVGVMGSFDHVDKVVPQLTDDSPTVRVRGVALMAAVSVVRKGPRREKRRKRLRSAGS